MIFVSIPEVEKKSFDGSVQSILKISKIAKIFRAGLLRGFDLAGMQAAVCLEYQIDFMAGSALVVVKVIRRQKTEFSAFLKLR